MAKMRVYELAKELGIENKQMLEFLNTKGFAVTSASSGVEEDAQNLARGKFGRRAEAPKEEAPKAEAPKAEQPKKDEKTEPAATDGQKGADRPKKKSSITAVFNAQYSKQGNRRPGQGGNRPQGGNNRPGQGGNRPQENRQARPQTSGYDVRKAFERAINPEAAKAAEEAEKRAQEAKRLAAEKGNKRLEEAFENKEVLTAKVSQVLDGGVCVNVDETRVFIPASLVSDTYEKDLSKYKDQDIEFVISEFNPKRRRIIGDRKQLLVAKKLEQQKELFAKIKVGDVMEGTVKNVTDFGAFIDLGGADGLLHISEMSWGRVESPKKVFNVGDHVRVFIKDINDTKIALSMKFPADNPWNGAAEKYAVGNVVTGKVARMTDFGAFVELAPGVDALLHVSQISKEHVEKPSDVLKVGQEIEAKIVDFNEDEKKISLSIKALLAPETNESEDADVADVDIDAVAAEEN